MLRGRTASTGPYSSVEALESRLLLSAVTLDPALVAGAAEPEALAHGGGCCCPGCAVRAPEALAAFAASAEAAPAALADTFQLHSLAGADFTIYLDFNGHTTSGTSWNSSYHNGNAIVSPAYDRDGNAASFSDSELLEIQRIWQRVAEDFRPFGVNVTTQDPGVDALRKSGTSDSRWGIRAVQTADQSWLRDNIGSTVGGIAYTGSFTWNTDTPVFSFNSGEVNAADTLSHEVGHALGLTHDGSSSGAYYYGHGSGATGWAPIMGAGFAKSLSQWSKGEYPNANQFQDDLAIITGNNGFGYRSDDHGGTNGAATLLSWAGAGLSAEGLIERNTDVDVFAIDVGLGTLSLDVSAFERGPNLDVLASLYNAAGQLVASSNPITALNASLSVLVTAGRYYLHIDGVGKDASGSDHGYTDYGSLGYYGIVGGFLGITTTPVVSVAVSPSSKHEDATGTIAYTFSRTGDLSQALSVSFSVSGTATYGSDYTASGASSFSLTNGSLTFAVGSATAVLLLDPVADSLVELDENALITLLPAGGYTLGTGNAANAFIVNDDSLVAVTGLTAAATSSSRINLGWTAVGGATGYKVERSNNGGATWTQIGLASGTNFSDTALAAATLYHYRVRATNLSGDGSYSVTISESTFATLSSGSRKFDFGTGSSPAAEGYTNVSSSTGYSSALGYGWTDGKVSSRDRGTSDALTRDFALITDATFAVDLANGVYQITLTFGDALAAHEQMGVDLEGARVGSVSTARGEYVTRTYTVTVSDGQLTLRLRDLGGASPYVVLNGLEITADSAPPTDPPTDPAPVQRFDFGTGSSPAAEGYTNVSSSTGYSSALGYGWTDGKVSSRDRGTSDALTRDFALITDATFAVDLANGVYQITLTFGDALAAHEQMGVDLEGARVGSVSTARGEYVTRTYTVTVSDGQLTLRLRDLGGASPYVVLNGLEITADSAPPTDPPTDPAPVQRFDFGTGSSPAAEGYTNVSSSTGYSSALGYGWTDGKVSSRDRGTSDALTRDFALITDATFAVDLANGVYQITLTFGDALAAHEQMGVDLEGARVGSVSTARGEYVTRTYTVTVSDGQLTLRLRDLGGASPYVVLNGLDVEEVFASDPSDWLLSA